MNTTAKGNRFENEVLEFFRWFISTDQFWAKKECCRLVPKPKYYSQSRQADITFDIAIEIWQPNATDPSTICLIECKNYDHPVPVDDIEEFDHKRQHLIGSYKGILVSKGAFQRGTQAVAKTRGVGLVRLFGGNEHKWVLQRSTAADVVSATSDQLGALCAGMVDEEFRPLVLDALFEGPAGVTTSIWEFFDGLFSIPRDAEWFAVQTEVQRIGGIVPFMEEARIEEIAESVARAAATRFPVDLDMICRREWLNSGLKIERPASSMQSHAPMILGRIHFADNVIELFDQNARHPQHLRFTLAHELGHYFLNHGQYLAIDAVEAEDMENQRPSYVDLTDIKRLEWQANRFAAMLLMPKKEFIAEFSNLINEHGIHDKGFGALYVDGQPDNQTAYFDVCRELARRFNVSFGAVAVRLKGLGLLNDRRYTSVAQGLFEIMPNPSW